MAQIEHDFDELVLIECWSSRTFIFPTLKDYRSSMTTSNPIQNDAIVVYLKEEFTVHIEEPYTADCYCLL